MSRRKHGGIRHSNSRLQNDLPTRQLGLGHKEIGRREDRSQDRFQDNWRQALARDAHDSRLPTRHQERGLSWLPTLRTSPPGVSVGCEN